MLRILLFSCCIVALVALEDNTEMCAVSYGRSGWFDLLNVYTKDVYTTKGVYTTVDAWVADDIPSPMVEPGTCDRIGDSWICNPDGIISESTADWFDDYIFNLLDATSGDEECNGGYTVATSWIDAMVLNTDETETQGAERFATTIFNNWELDSCGVLIFVAVDDGQLYIRVGEQAYQIVNDEKLQYVIDLMVGYLSEGQYDQALEVGTTEIAVYLSNSGLSEQTLIIIIVLGTLAALALLTVLVLVIVATCRHDNGSSSGSDTEMSTTTRQNTHNYATPSYATPSYASHSTTNHGVSGGSSYGKSYTSSSYGGGSYGSGSSYGKSYGSGSSYGGSSSYGGGSGSSFGGGGGSSFGGGGSYGGGGGGGFSGGGSFGGGGGGGDF